MNSFLTNFKQQFANADYSLQIDDLIYFANDWTKDFKGQAQMVFFPHSTQELADFLKFCSLQQQPVVPSGGRTGLAGGAVANQHEVVVSMSKMNKIIHTDQLALTMTVEAGVVSQQIHQEAAQYNLTFPVKFASQGSSQIGGNIATNAGGVQVIAHGLTRQWVMGLTVVLMTGEVLTLNGSLEKNNTGYDLKHLFIGSEGTLGIITEAVLKLKPQSYKKMVSLVALNTFNDVLSFLQRVRTEIPVTLSAFEFFDRSCLELVCERQQLANPWPHCWCEYAVLLEFELASAQQEPLVLSWLEELLANSGYIQEFVLSQNETQAEALWQYRERISETLAQNGWLHKNDIALPLKNLQIFMTEYQKLMTTQFSQFESFVFGHVGDGNLHLNSRQPQTISQQQFLAECVAMDNAVYELVSKYEGSISAEHGIGLLKKPYLNFSRSLLEIKLMQQLKSVFDPQRLLNRDKIFKTLE